MTRLWKTPSAGMFMSTTSGSIDLDDREEEPLGRLAEEVVLLERPADDGRRRRSGRAGGSPR